MPGTFEELREQAREKMAGIPLKIKENSPLLSQVETPTRPKIKKEIHVDFKYLYEWNGPTQFDLLTDEDFKNLLNEDVGNAIHYIPVNDAAFRNEERIGWIKLDFDGYIQLEENEDDDAIEGTYSFVAHEWNPL